jgi:cell wall-associated NlpC family hydrolase
MIAAVASVVALAAGRSGGGSDARASGTSVASQAAAAAVQTSGSGATTAPTDATSADGEVDPLAPLPKSRAKVVSPVAGEATDTDAAAGGSQAASPQDDLSLPTPKGPATKTERSQTQAPAVRDLSVDEATALPNGVALPPLEAPEAVLQVIRAGNTIARTPYKWGGGHGSFKDNGYDCSGSVSFALFSAGLIEGSRTSGGLMSWGQAGKGRWITVYANGGHTFMEVAGIRFDTSGRQVTGSRWQNEFRSTAGFVARHPAGL